MVRRLRSKICVIGIGRVGLPLSLAFADMGHKVYGVDKDNDHIARILSGKMPFLEEGAQELLDKTLNKSFYPGLDIEKAKDADFVMLTLGTPVDENLNPDYRQLDEVLEKLIKIIRKGQTIILRSTIAPGTTRLICDRIEKDTGLFEGTGFFLAYCPERIAEGNSLKEFREVPQIIGGMSEKSSSKAKELFLELNENCLITDPESAELAKIFSNMYRYINFAIANEFAILSLEHKRDIHEIIELVNKDYKRGGVSQPGLTAGPCLYKDGFFLLNAMPFNELISVSWRINENLPVYIINSLKRSTSIKGKKVALLGMAFKKNIDDTRQSLSFKMKKLLQKEQAILIMDDPYLERYSTELEKELSDSDIIIFAVNHDEYSRYSTDYLKSIVRKGCIVCDIWNVTGAGKLLYKLE